MATRVRRSVMYLQFAPAGALPPLHNSARQLMARGWEVAFMGVGALGAERMTLEGLPLARLIQLPAPQRGWRARARYAHFVAGAIAAAIRWRPSHLYVSDPPACPAALAVQAFTGAPFLYHEHDSPELPGDAAWLRLSCAARRIVARRALRCVLPNNERALTFEAATGSRRTVVVWNCPSRTEVPPQRSGRLHAGLRLYYHGTLNPYCFPDSTLHAVAATPASVTLRVLGPETVGSVGYRSHLAALAHRLGIERRVSLEEPVPRARLFAEAQACDVGLVLMPRTPPNMNYRYMVGASNKAFDYLACGLPLIVSDLPDWRATFVDTGYGVACDPGNPLAIATAIHRYLDRPDERTRMGLLGRAQVLNNWNYETQFGPILEALEDDVGRRQVFPSGGSSRTSARRNPA